jgi:disease resistance protein RPM1
MIAVKKLGENCPVAHDKTFSNEVCNLMAAQHENIVKLVGYCHESQKKVVQHNGRYIIVDIAEVFLCYEYLPMGSLDKYLFGMYMYYNIRQHSPLFNSFNVCILLSFQFLL